MAKTVLGPNSTVTVNGINLSTYVGNVTIEDTTDEVDVTGFGQVYREFLPGLKDSSITLTVVQDTAGIATPDAVLGQMYYTGAAGTVKVNPDTAGTVVYTQVCKVYSWPPASGGPGEANSIDVTLRNFGTLGLQRGTS